MFQILYDLGYYICKIESIPDYLQGISEKIISVSNCICEHEPQIFCCHGWKPNGDKAEYLRSINLSREQYLVYSSEAQKLFDNGRLFTDGRFLFKSDAAYFYGKYFNSCDYILICLAAEKEDCIKLSKQGLQHTKPLMPADSEQILGYDIIGKEFCNDTFLDSFLSNSLHEEADELSFNEYGLIDTDFSTVKKYARAIYGKGEAIEWTPVVICLCNYSDEFNL